MTTMATRSRISAYSTSPCPRCRTRIAPATRRPRSTTSTAAELRYDVLERCLDLLSHREQYAHDDDRDQDQDQGVFDQALPVLPGQQPTESHVLAEHASFNLLDVKHGNPVIEYPPIHRVRDGPRTWALDPTSLGPRTILLGSVLVASLALLIRPVTDRDFWLHAATGRWIVEHAQLPSHDLFTYTVPGHRWVNHEYLSEVVLWLLQA